MGLKDLFISSDEPQQKAVEEKPKVGWNPSKTTTTKFPETTKFPSFEQEAETKRLEEMKKNNAAAGISTATSNVTTVSPKSKKSVTGAQVVTKPRDIQILDKNGLLPPIKHAKLKGLNNEIKVLFSNRTFVYNLINDSNNTNAWNKQFLQIANFLYTDDIQKPSINIQNINITNPIIEKSFCYSPDDDTELDDLLTKTEINDNKKWFKNLKVKVLEPSPKNDPPTPFSVEYTHYKRIW